MSHYLFFQIFYTFFLYQFCNIFFLSFHNWNSFSLFWFSFILLFIHFLTIIFFFPNLFYSSSISILLLFYIYFLHIFFIHFFSCFITLSSFSNLVNITCFSVLYLFLSFTLIHNNSFILNHWHTPLFFLDLNLIAKKKFLNVMKGK